MDTSGGATGPGGSGDGGRRRPQAPVLDLKAADVTAGAAGAESLAEGSPEPKNPEPASPARGRGGRVAGLIAGTAIGAAAGAAALAAVAWWFGVPLTREDRSAEAARIAALEARIETLASRPAPVPDPRVATLATQVAALDQALASLRALEARLAKAEAVLAEPRPAGADPEMQRRVAAVDDAVKTLSGAVGEIRRRIDEVATVAQGARDMASRASGATSAAATSAAGDIDALMKRVAALEAATRALQTAAAQTDRPDRDRTARLATAVLVLKPRVESGAPFAAELAAVKALSADPAPLAPLEAAAATGVPGAAVLAKELAALVAQQRKTESAPAPQDAGLWARVRAAISSLVRVRPAGAPPPSPEGGDPLARVQAAAARGALSEAAAEAQKLPEAARQALAPWTAKAQARVAALAALETLARDSLAALAASSPEPASR